MSVTQEDRIAAASVAVLPEMRELILAGKADHHAEPWAACREKAFLAGARAMQAMLGQIEPDEEAAGCPPAWGDFVQIAQSIDPTILKEQGDG